MFAIIFSSPKYHRLFGIVDGTSTVALRGPGSIPGWTLEIIVELSDLEQSYPAS